MKRTSKIFTAGMTALSGLTALLAAPMITAAQAANGSSLSQTNDLNGLVAKAIGLFNAAVYLIVALAILTFVWNVYQYFIVKDPENKKEAGTYVMYSVIGIFVILSFWGLVNIISNTLNINSSPGTVNVANLIGNITGGSAGSSLNPSLSSPNSLFPSSGNSIYNNGIGGNSTGGTGYNSGSIGGNSTGGTGYSNSAYQQAYQAQANNDQAALENNHCYTASGAVVSTPACQSLQTAYLNDQAQANLYSGGSSSGVSNLQQCIDAGGDPGNCDSQYGSASNPSLYQQCIESGTDASACDSSYGISNPSAGSSGTDNTGSDNSSSYPPDNYSINQDSSGASGNQAPAAPADNSGSDNSNSDNPGF